LTGAGRFVEVQGTAEQTPFDLAQLEALLDLARRGLESLIGLQRRALADRATTVFTLS
jgi:ribonuclease PH